MLLLNIPYEEKDEAKALGAAGDPIIKNGLFFRGRISISLISGYPQTTIISLSATAFM
ncbi:MAG: hypothetical protein IJ555_04320 [Ruminococcus sp.]|nr:hypothetical protein [Ruminococcus sp.]